MEATYPVANLEKFDEIAAVRHFLRWIPGFHRRPSPPALIGRLINLPPRRGFSSGDGQQQGRPSVGLPYRSIAVPHRCRPKAPSKDLPPPAIPESRPLPDAPGHGSAPDIRNRGRRTPLPAPGKGVAEGAREAEHPEFQCLPGRRCPEGRQSPKPGPGSTTAVRLPAADSPDSPAAVSW
jgi:hypothetical protein